MNNEKNPLIFLQHILDNINKIEDFSKNISKTELKENYQKQYAIIKGIEIIGEATKNISKNFIEKNPQVPWREIIGTRDKMIHHYFGIDLDIVWKIIKEELPQLKKQIMEIIKQNEK